MCTLFLLRVYDVWNLHEFDSVDTYLHHRVLDLVHTFERECVCRFVMFGCVQSLPNLQKCRFMFDRHCVDGMLGDNHHREWFVAVHFLKLNVCVVACVVVEGGKRSVGNSVKYKRHLGGCDLPMIVGFRTSGSISYIFSGLTKTKIVYFSVVVSVHHDRFRTFS